MSDMPERIWAYDNAGYGANGGWSSPLSPFWQPNNPNVFEYVRHDAPLTPAEAMARCPEVADRITALSAALTRIEWEGDEHSQGIAKAALYAAAAFTQELKP